MKALIIKASLIAAMAMAVDQATKAIARGTFAICDSPPFSRCEQLDFGFFGFARVENAGSALGFEQGLPLWIIVSIVGLFFIPLYAKRLAPFGGLGALAIGLQAGGALGNLLDRVLFGGVTDFIVVGRVILINPADIALLAGMFLAAALMLRQPMSPSEPAGATVAAG